VESVGRHVHTLPGLKRARAFLFTPGLRSVDMMSSDGTEPLGRAVDRKLRAVRDAPILLTCGGGGDSGSADQSLKYKRLSSVRGQ